MPPPVTLNASTNLRSLISNSRSQLALSGNNIIKYPREIDETPHKVLFKFSKRGIRQEGNTQRASNSTGMFLVLPVPSQIKDGTSVDITGTNLGLSGELISGMSNYMAGLDFSTFPAAAASGARTAGDIYNLVSGRGRSQLTGFASELGQAGLQYIGGNVINSALSSMGISNPQAQAAIAVGLGRILNPFTTAVFGGVKLRTFNFKWLFSPDNPSDSIELERVIKRLRAKSLPTVSTNNLFMEFPHEVEFTYLGMQNDTFSFPTAPCYISDLQVDRTAAGQPVFFAGTGAPAFVSIALSLIEIRPLVSKGNEYDDVDTNSTFVRNQAAAAVNARDRAQVRRLTTQRTGTGNVGFTETN